MYYGWWMWWYNISMLTRRSLWSSTWPNQQSTSLWNLNSSCIILSHQERIMVHLLLHKIISSISIKTWRCSLATFHILFAFSFNSLHILNSIWPIIHLLSFLARLLIILPTDAGHRRVVILPTNPKIHIHFAWRQFSVLIVMTHWSVRSVVQLPTLNHVLIWWQVVWTLDVVLD